jgi:hypothetical protein
LLGEFRSDPELSDVSDENITRFLVGVYETILPQRPPGITDTAIPRRITKRSRAFAAGLREAFVPRYDEVATADKEAVTSFMRGGRHEPAPRPALPRNLNSMSDSEFKKILDRIEPGMAEKTRI